MNNLINLARQAGLEIDEWEDQNDYKVHGMKRELEQFYNLVVEECIHYAFSDEQEQKLMGKHFGIES
jgi:hypothetical protein